MDKNKVVLTESWIHRIEAVGLDNQERLAELVTRRTLVSPERQALVEANPSDASEPEHEVEDASSPTPDLDVPVEVEAHSGLTDVLEGKVQAVTVDVATAQPVELVAGAETPQHEA